MKTLTIILLLVSLWSFNYETKNLQLDLSSNEEIEKILWEFTDSVKVKKALGDDYILEVGSRHLNTINSCNSTLWHSLDYKNQGIKIVISNKSETPENKSSRIILNSKANWKIKGISCGKSKFEETLKETGNWYELGDIQGDYNLFQFGYVTKFVQYRTKPLSDTDSLDYENKKQMETLFESENVYNIVLTDNQKFMKL